MPWESRLGPYREVYADSKRIILRYPARGMASLFFIGGCMFLGFSLYVYFKSEIPAQRVFVFAPVLLSLVAFAAGLGHLWKLRRIEIYPAERLLVTFTKLPFFAANRRAHRFDDMRSIDVTIRDHADADSKGRERILTLVILKRDGGHIDLGEGHEKKEGFALAERLSKVMGVPIRKDDVTSPNPAP